MSDSDKPACAHRTIRRLDDSADDSKAAWGCEGCGTPFFPQWQVEKIVEEADPSMVVDALAETMTHILWGLHQKAIDAHGSHVVADVDVPADVLICEDEGHDWGPEHCDRCGKPRFLGA